MSSNELKQKKNWKISILHINSFLSAVPRIWRVKIETSDFTYSKIPRFSVIIKTCPKEISKLKSLEIYWELLRNVIQLPTAIGTWVDLFPFLEGINWTPVFTGTNKVTSEPYLQSFQYKIINRTLNCNYNLFKWKILDHSTCNYCPLNIDTIEHHLYYCNKSKEFWEEIENWLEATLQTKFSFTICEVIFGMLYIDTNIFHSINYVILLGKWYINSSKIHEKRICLLDFLNLVKEKLMCMNLTCTLTGTEINFLKSFRILYQKLCL